MGIEPTLLAWEAKVLPLNYTRDTPILRQWQAKCQVAWTRFREALASRLQRVVRGGNGCGQR